MSKQVEDTLSRPLSEKGKLDKDQSRFLNTVVDNLRANLQKVQRKKESNRKGRNS